MPLRYSRHRTHQLKFRLPTPIPRFPLSDGHGGKTFVPVAQVFRSLLRLNGEAAFSFAYELLKARIPGPGSVTRTYTLALTKEEYEKAYLTARSLGFNTPNEMLRHYLNETAPSWEASRRAGGSAK